jgi:hypothetical protein
VFWLKIDLHYRPTNPQAQRTRCLNCLSPLDHIDLYLLDARQLSIAQTGDALLFATRDRRTTTCSI